MTFCHYQGLGQMGNNIIMHWEIGCSSVVGLREVMSWNFLSLGGDGATSPMMKQALNIPHTL